MRLLCIQCGEFTEGTIEQCSDCGSDPRLGGAYGLLNKLGHGAVGTTYRAVRFADEKLVAVKELLVRRLDNFKTEELFHREAAVLKQLSHPGIPACFDELTAGDKRHLGFYLVTELIDGHTITEEMKTRRYTEPEVLAFLDEILGILAYLHTLNPPVVHRDLKPSNIMRRESDGRLLLIDFGAVTDVKNDAMGGSTVAGTFGYMPPEQLAGQASPASDLYALGATALEMLTQRTPHMMTDATNQLQWEEALGDGVSFGLRGLLRRLLEPMATERLQSANAARDLVHALQQGTLPAELAEPEVESELFAIKQWDEKKEIAPEPPPAPREVTPAMMRRGSGPMDNFFLMFGVLFGGIGGGVGLIVGISMLASGIWFGAFIGGIFFFTFGGVGGFFARKGWKKRALKKELLANGKATLAQITDVYRDTSIAVNGRNPYATEYVYRDGSGVEQTGRTSAFRRLGQEGDKIWVLYSEGAPNESVLW